MTAILPRSFFNRPVVAVARDLIGCQLVRRLPDGRIVRHAITETEAYDGERDKASHASRGRTPRCAVMYGPAGYWYVYFTYGMHWMLNIVCREEGYPAAVLIRGLETPDKKRRNRSEKAQNLSGPARLTKALKIDKGLNGKVASRKSGLWIERPSLTGKTAAGQRENPRKILRTARIGVDYAGPIWSAKKYRFVRKDSMRKKESLKNREIY